MNMRKTALLMLAATLSQGCAPNGPLGAVGAIVTAPITAPIMFFSARMNDREAFLERARQNQRPLPPMDARSEAQARATLEQALERGAIDESLYWQNKEDTNGEAAGGVTVLAAGRTDDGRICREVQIVTTMHPRWTDQRVQTYCRDETGWSVVATAQG